MCDFFDANLRFDLTSKALCQVLKNHAPQCWRTFMDSGFN